MTVQGVTAPIKKKLLLIIIIKPHGGPIAHRSQDRNLTLLYTPGFQSYSSCLASYVIHGPPFVRSSILVSDTILIPIAQNPSGIKRLPTRSKLHHDPHYLALNDFLKFPLESCLYATFTGIVPRYLSCVELRPSRVFLPYSAS